MAPFMASLYAPILLSEHSIFKDFFRESGCRLSRGSRENIPSNVIAFFEILLDLSTERTVDIRKLDDHHMLSESNRSALSSGRAFSFAAVRLFFFCRPLCW